MQNFSRKEKFYQVSNHKTSTLCGNNVEVLIGVYFYYKNAKR